MALSMKTILNNRKLCFWFHKTKVQLAFRKVHSHYQAGNRNILNLHERGLFQTIFPQERALELQKLVVGKPQCIYCGFDPTADSLHVGHLVAVMAMLHCHRGGHKVLAVLGGATSMIGDPSGRTTERQPLDLTTLDTNINSIQTSLDTIFRNHDTFFQHGGDREVYPIQILNNAEWYEEWNVVGFLSSVGRHFRLGTMLGRQSVQSRLNSPEGMSFTEFCYQIFQAYDWLHLCKEHNCTIQIGGSDQMGNIVSGHDLISRVLDKNVYGLTVPLVTSTAGDKLGKTAGNAVWLDPLKTSPFELYQYFLRLPDTSMEKFLGFLTFFSLDTIREILKKHSEKPESRLAQRRLAEQVVTLVHGESGLASAKLCTAAMYNSDPSKLARLSQTELDDLFASTPTTELVLEPGTTVFDLVMKANCFGRAVDAERVIEAGGVHINHQRCQVPATVLRPGEHVLTNGITLIRIGKKNYYLVKWLATGLL